MSFTDILGWFNPTRWIALAVIVGGLVLGYFAWAHHLKAAGRTEGRAEIQAKLDAERTQWQGALAKQKLEATQLLAAETAKAALAEQRLGEFLINQERTDANHDAVVIDLQRSLAGVQLRDPYATAPGRGAGSSGSQSGAAAVAQGGAGNPADATGLLSERASADLRRLQFTADIINNAYASCRATAVNDRAQQSAK